MDGTAHMLTKRNTKQSIVRKIKEKSIRAKMHSYHLLKNHQEETAEVEQRKLRTTSEVVMNPSQRSYAVAFSHNGTYPQGASPKIVQDANITELFRAQSKSTRMRYARKGKHLLKGMHNLSKCKKEAMRVSTNSNHGIKKFIFVPSC